MVSMAQPLKLKVYLKKNNVENSSSTEIRRFTIDADVATNFMYLQNCLQTVFPDIREKRFTIKWKDFENDEILISGCKELESAIDELQKLPIIKLYVTLHSDNDNENKSESNFAQFETPDNQKTIHFGIICDGCDNVVYGFRYKCLQCFDYDLCSRCEAKGLHAEHCMIRAALPLQWKSCYGRKLFHHLNKFMRKALTCPLPLEDCPFKSRKHLLNRHPDRLPPWTDTFRTFLNGWTNLPDECPVMDHNKPKDSNSEENTKTDKKTSSASNEKLSIGSHLKLIKTMSENMTRFLDPLGIDVNVEVKTDESSSNEKPRLDIKSPEASTPQNVKKAVINDDKNQNKVDKPEQSTSNDVQEKVLPVLKTDSKQENENSSDAANLKVDGWTLVDKDSVSSSSDFDSDKAPHDQQKSSDNNAENSKATDDKTLYPSLENANDTFWHTDPWIHHAVKSMMQMGYSNEGGWLTEFLVSVNGNISTALDILKPVHQ